MATIFSHAIVGCTIVSVLPKKFKTRAIYFYAGLSAIVPDFDYIGFAARVPYDSLWGHRGMTHSLLFAVAMGMFFAFLSEKKWNRFFFQLSAVFFLTTISHAVIDACTNGGLGVAFYAPYNLFRYFFPWRPIQVSPMGLSFFSERGLVVLISEIYWILIPCVVIAIIRHFFVHIMSKQNPP